MGMGSFKRYVKDFELTRICIVLAKIKLIHKWLSDYSLK